MRIIISPAKKMNVDTDSLDILGLPRFLEEAEVLKSTMHGMRPQELQALWRCNGIIAKRSFGQLWNMDLHRNLTPAILAYEGIQYRYMAPGAFEYSQYEYIGEHLRILSGFYGVLRPFDGVAPYRLEMQARLPVAGHGDLYSFWGDKPARALCGESDVILNLASDEYSRAVTDHLPKGIRLLCCTFGELKEGRIIQKGTLCKMARGRIVRWLAENNVTRPEDIKSFEELGYRYHAERSTEDKLVFLKDTGRHIPSVF